MRVLIIAGIILMMLGMSSIASEVIHSQRKNSDSEYHDKLATQWDLTSKEYQRYLKLKKTGQARYFWESLDPVMVLGLSAEDDAEREKYAEKYAILMRQRVKAELAWERAYQAADKRLFPDQQQAIDHDLLYPKSFIESYAQRSQQLLSGDEVNVLMPRGSVRASW